MEQRKINGGQWSTAGHEGNSIGSDVLDGMSFTAGALSLQPPLQCDLAWAGMPFQAPLRIWLSRTAAAPGEPGISSESGRDLFPPGGSEGPVWIISPMAASPKGGPQR